MITLRTDNQDSLEKLKPVIMDASGRTECLRGTRVDVLRFTMDWVNDPTTNQRILWLYGLAGSGKSTLSTTIANIFNASGELGAFLFFDRDVTERSNPSTVVRTLAHQLAGSHPAAARAIRAVIERNTNIFISPLRLQFQKLILEPLSAVTGVAPKIILVLDALDECGTASQRNALLSMLAHDFIHMIPSVRTIIASRPEIDICSAFESQSHILAHELDITSEANSDDIMLYFRYHMALIRTQKKYLRLNLQWPGEEVLCELVQRASGLFVWASTVCEFMNGHDPRKRMDAILKGQVGSSAELALDNLYTTALLSLGNWDDEDFVADFRSIMGIVLVARRPLSSESIDVLLNTHEENPSMHTISLLGCLIQHTPTVRVLHPSFSDFMTTQRRCGQDMWFFHQSICHRKLAFQCLAHMDTVLKRNICNMTLSVNQADEGLSEVVSYSCLFWIDHICVIEDDLVPVVDRLHGFLNRHLLHWFEAMSIMKRSRDTIDLVDRLYDWLSVGHFAI